MRSASPEASGRARVHVVRADPAFRTSELDRRASNAELRTRNFERPFTHRESRCGQFESRFANPAAQKRTPPVRGSSFLSVRRVLRSSARRPGGPRPWSLHPVCSLCWISLLPSSPGGNSPHSPRRQSVSSPTTRGRWGRSNDRAMLYCKRNLVPPNQWLVRARPGASIAAAHPEARAARGFRKGTRRRDAQKALMPVSSRPIVSW